MLIKVGKLLVIAFKKYMTSHGLRSMICRSVPTSLYVLVQYSVIFRPAHVGHFYVFVKDNWSRVIDRGGLGPAMPELNVFFRYCHCISMIL